MHAWQTIAEHIAESTGRPFDPSAPRSLGGGCINQALLLADDRSQWFVKFNSRTQLPMFEAEYAGLAALAATDTIGVPQPLLSGTAGEYAYLVMEYLELGPGSHDSARLAGRQLAALHRSSAANFGWTRDNTIGSTPQINAWTRNWGEFWQHHRLGYQLELAARRGFRGRLQSLGERLLARVPELLAHNPSPALMHGDLWGGNMAYTASGRPVIYDPAPYFGDREAEIAMTELFGGFGRDFYAAYQEAWPLDPGYATRKTLYNLYHILNHLNLFGAGYAGQAESMMQRLLAA
jgi:fructosamine-3-kinase